MDRYIHLRQQARDAFEIRYERQVDPDRDRWERCSRVLARRDHRREAFRAVVTLVNSTHIAAGNCSSDGTVVPGERRRARPKFSDTLLGTAIRRTVSTSLQSQAVPRKAAEIEQRRR